MSHQDESSITQSMTHNLSDNDESEVESENPFLKNLKASRDAANHNDSSVSDDSSQISSHISKVSHNESYH